MSQSLRSLVLGEDSKKNRTIVLAETNTLGAGETGITGVGSLTSVIGVHISHVKYRCTRRYTK